MNEPSTKKKPVDYEELHPGRFLKAADFKGQKVTLTINETWLEELEGEDGKELKAYLTFKERPKELVLNRTNSECLKAMFGSKLPQWEGKRVTLYPSVVTERGMLKGKDCIRVWGSPDIAHDLDIIIKRPRQDAKKITLHKVVMGRAEPETKAPAAREPGDDK
jgi:hypothetical protein